MSVSSSFGVVSGRPALCIGLFWDFAGFPKCFWALSSGRTTARAATNFHEKDLSHTQLRVSAPLNSPLRSQVARSALRRLFLSVVFSPFPLLLALILPLVLLCVVFFTHSPLPTPLASASALAFSSARSLVAVVCGSGGGVAVGAWSRLFWDRRRRPVVACCGGCWGRFAFLIFCLELKMRFFSRASPPVASGRLRSPPVASGRLRSPPVDLARLTRA